MKHASYSMCVIFAASCLVAASAGCPRHPSSNTSGQSSTVNGDRILLLRMDDVEPLGEFSIQHSSNLSGRENASTHIAILWQGGRMAKADLDRSLNELGESVGVPKVTITAGPLTIGGESIITPDGGRQIVVSPIMMFHAVVFINNEPWSGVVEVGPLREGINGSLLGESKITMVPPSLYPSFDYAEAKIPYAALVYLDMNNLDSTPFEPNWTVVEIVEGGSIKRENESGP